MDIKAFIKSSLDKLSFLDDNERLSWSNLTVAVFVIITAFRSLFGGSDLVIAHLFDWKIQTVDMAATLPVLFSLANYAHKRNIRYKANCCTNTDDNKEKHETPIDS